MNSIHKIADSVIYGLLTAKEMNIPYYIKDNFEYLFDEDDMFITDDEIIDEIKKRLPKDLELLVTPIKRELQCENEEDNFFYGDTQLEIVKNKIYASTN